MADSTDLNGLHRKLSPPPPKYVRRGERRDTYNTPPLGSPPKHALADTAPWALEDEDSDDDHEHDNDSRSQAPAGPTGSATAARPSPAQPSEPPPHCRDNSARRGDSALGKLE
ncbi:hypothetical protein LZ31DRAFT_595143 [Colletotrichum somersetense]|nr:hypothetical protein LZ31DRAFT_595143 [Colletotrichum somersetense]